MQRSPRRHRNAVWADRLTVGEEDGDIDVRCLVAGVENAGSLVRDQSAIGKRALRRDVSFGNGPTLAADGSMITSSQRDCRRRFSAHAAKKTPKDAPWFHRGNFPAARGLS